MLNRKEDFKLEKELNHLNTKQIEEIKENIKKAEKLGSTFLNTFHFVLSPIIFFVAILLIFFF